MVKKKKKNPRNFYSNFSDSGQKIHELSSKLFEVLLEERAVSSRETANCSARAICTELWGEHVEQNVGPQLGTIGLAVPRHTSSQEPRPRRLVLGSSKSIIVGKV